MCLQLPQGRRDADLALGELRRQCLDADRRPGGQRLDVDRQADRRRQVWVLGEAGADYREVVVMAFRYVPDTGSAGLRAREG